MMMMIIIWHQLRNLNKCKAFKYDKNEKETHTHTPTRTHTHTGLTAGHWDSYNLSITFYIISWTVNPLPWSRAKLLSFKCCFRWSFSRYVFVHSLHRYPSKASYVPGSISKQDWHFWSNGDAISWHRNITSPSPVLTMCLTRAKGGKTPQEYFLLIQVSISFRSDGKTHDWRPWS